MTAVVLDVVNENKWLGFETEPKIGDIVTAAYDFGCGATKVTGTYEGVETRGTGEKFAWVREHDGTRYAIPVGFIEVMRVEAKGEDLPVTDGRSNPIAVPSERARHNLRQSHHMRSHEGRVCARLDYEGQVL